jgi:hypothetical protein
MGPRLTGAAAGAGRSRVAGLPLATMNDDQRSTLDWLVGQLSPDHPHDRSPRIEDLVVPTWRSLPVARLALKIAQAVAGRSRPEPARRAGSPERWVAGLRDARGRGFDLEVEFATAQSGLLAGFAVLPRLTDGLDVRLLTPDDTTSLNDLEKAAAIERDDGTEVVAEHHAPVADRQRLVPGRCTLGVFAGSRLVAVQAVVTTTTHLGGAERVVAVNGHSRSDPGVRGTGSLLHLVMRQYLRLWSGIDQAVSFVDIRNGTGLRLSFGDPWPRRTHRLFLPVETLAAQRDQSITPGRFEPGRAAALLNHTHGGNALYQPHTTGRLKARLAAAPDLYGPGTWLQTPNAALGYLTHGETRTYRRPGLAPLTRRLAPVVDYGFDGERGREELGALLTEAACRLQPSGVTHLALFAADQDDRVTWLHAQAKAHDTYAVASPTLAEPPVPAGPVHVDPLLF